MAEKPTATGVNAFDVASFGLIYSSTIGGAANTSITGACPAGYSFQDGGAWIDEIF